MSSLRVKESRSPIEISSSEQIIKLNKLHVTPVNFSLDAELKYGEPSKVAVFFLKLDEKHTFCLISVDLIWISNDLAEDLRNKISKLTMTPVHRISIVASHTHGSANDDPDFDFGLATQSYVNTIKDSIISCVNRAYTASFETVVFKVVEAETDKVSINRRRKALFIHEGKIRFRTQNLPNFNAPHKHKFRKLEFRRVADGSLAALIFHLSCHPVADPASTVGADFPGFLRRFSQEKDNSNIPVGFIQGFSGDLRPKLIFKPRTLKDWILELIIGKRFRPSVSGDSATLAKTILKAFEEKNSRATELFDITPVSSKEEKIKIKLESGQTLKKELCFISWFFGEMKFQFLSAEVLSGFQNDDDKKHICIDAGYANGMVGYIPTSEDLLTGGYEVDGSRKKFGISRRISEEFALFLRDKLIQK